MKNQAWDTTALLELGFDDPALLSSLFVAGVVLVVSLLVFCLQAAPRHRAVDGRHLVKEFEGREQVQVIFLQPPPGLEMIGVPLDSILGAKHIRLPDPDDCASRAIEQVEYHKEMLYAWQGGQTSCGNQVWIEFLLPTMREVTAIIGKRDQGDQEWAREQDDKDTAARSDVDNQRLLSLLWSLALPCCESLGGDNMWLIDNEVYTEDEYQQFFANLMRLLPTVLTCSNKSLRIRESDREVMWSVFKDYVVLLHDWLEQGGGGDVLSRDEFGFELEDEHSPHYVRGLEAVQPFATPNEEHEQAA